MTTTTPTLGEFGARLALVRWNYGRLNVKEAAVICGVPAASWRDWELNGAMPRDYLGVCKQISDRLGVDLEWLVFGPGDDTSGQPAGYHELAVA